MTSWPDFAALPALDLKLLGALAPVEVLYEFDGPCIFTALTEQRNLVLAYLSEELEDERLLRFVVATTSEATIAAMKDGSVSVREALERGSLWLVDLDHAYRPKRAAACRLSDLPGDALPASTTMLWPALEPALIVRLEGSEIRRGSIPAAVFAQAAEISGKALKPVFEWAAKVLRGETSGRPPDWLRLLYGLPAQRIAFGSLEIAFRPADVSSASQQTLPFGGGTMPSAQEIHASGWRAIAEGLEWSVSDAPVPANDGDDEKWLSILESMKKLAPASTGPVNSVSVSGRLVGAPRRPFELTRASTRRIRAALTELKKRHEVQLRVFRGRVRDLDLDKLTLILRDVPGESADVPLALADEQLLEVAREAHYQELEVSVAARSEDRKLWTATEIEFAKGGVSESGEASGESTT
jgi:hypothetical protein